MSTEKRTASSKEMRKNKAAVGLMAKKLSFDENIGKINWKPIRRISNFCYKFMPKEKSVVFYRSSVGGVPCMIAEPRTKTTDNVILYIHGGGFVSGSAIGSKGYCSMLAKYGKCTVVAVDYTLSPEAKYPTALNQCAKVYNTIVKRRKDCKIAVCGESAGGNLSLALTLKIMAEGGVKPACVMAHSPLCDFSGSLDRSMYHIDDFMVKAGCAEPLGEVYGCENERKSPYASPIYGDFTGFPPLLLTCDVNETLYADSAAVYEKASECGVDVRMIEMEGAFHAYAIIGSTAPETKKILDECIELFRENF